MFIAKLITLDSLIIKKCKGEFVCIDNKFFEKFLKFKFPIPFSHVMEKIKGTLTCVVDSLISSPIFIEACINTFSHMAWGEQYLFQRISSVNHMGERFLIWNLSKDEASCDIFGEMEINLSLPSGNVSMYIEPYASPRKITCNDISQLNYQGVNKSCTKLNMIFDSIIESLPLYEKMDMLYSAMNFHIKKIQRKYDLPPMINSSKENEQIEREREEYFSWFKRIYEKRFGVKNREVVNEEKFTKIIKYLSFYKKYSFLDLIGLINTYL